LSTLSQPHPTPKWKEEVNRRIAAHKNRKNGSAQDATPQQASDATSRAAQAAARVAARYAKAPSYSEMQAQEARVAVRAAEIATKVALEAQAAAESALAELHAASQSRGPAVVENIAEAQRKLDQEAPVRNAADIAHSSVQPREEVSSGPQPPAPEIRYQQPYAVRWDADLPIRPAERKPAPRVHEEFELAVEDWWSPAEIGSALRNEPLEVVGPDSTQANLIQFPRELVATRKMRPRLAESCSGTLSEAEGQLSIFEVDPHSITTEMQAPVQSHDAAAPMWNRPEWSGIQLDAHPAAPRSTKALPETSPITHLAPFGLRFMATVIDCALILACFVLVGFIAAGSFHHPPTGKPAELLGMFSLVAIGLAYYGVFFSLGMSTPGMKYAGIGLCTFDDKSPTRAQLHRRLGAMALSLLPVGLGVVWSVFDEDHLSWHDRISQTYLRKC
jgi:uncharacterized RDD family membrane protein YckC